MNIQVTGKQIDIGESLREHVLGRIEDVVSKYVDTNLSGHIRIEKVRNAFVTRCDVRLGWGLQLQSTGQATDPYASAEDSFEKLEKRLRRHKRRLLDRHQGGELERTNRHASLAATDYVIPAASEDDDETASPSQSDDAPLIVAERQTVLDAHSVSDAVMALDLSDAPCLVFQNEATGRLNVIYRRHDGNIGWIDPTHSGS